MIKTFAICLNSFPHIYCWWVFYFFMYFIVNCFMFALWNCLNPLETFSYCLFSAGSSVAHFLVRMVHLIWGPEILIYDKPGRVKLCLHPVDIYYFPVKKLVFYRLGFSLGSPPGISVSSRPYSSCKPKCEVLIQSNGDLHYWKSHAVSLLFLYFPSFWYYWDQRK